MSKLLTPFLYKGRLDKALLAAFLIINGLILVNAILHDPAVGYDAGDHLKIIKLLARNGQWPTVEQTKEFFSPPLPYLLPALVLRLRLFDAAGAAKFAQLINVGLSLLLTYFLLKLCDQFIDDDSHLKLAALTLLGILPVYYRTFAFVRGEPYVATLAVIASYQTLCLFSAQKKFPHAAALGIELGLLILARQWGFFLFPAIGILAAMLAWKEGHIAVVSWTALSFVMAFVVGGWFYLLLLRQYGSVSAFNKTPAESFAFSNQPSTFYFGMGDGLLFRDPVRPAFANQFLPIFYSDTWGDYWMYFTIYGRDKNTGESLSGVFLLNAVGANPPEGGIETNRFQAGSYQGRVNFIALFPTALLLMGWVAGLVDALRHLRIRPVTNSQTKRALLALIVLFSFLGYAWFLIRYPSLGEGDTIKATYLIQIFPLLAVLAAGMLARMRTRWPYIERAVYIILVVIFIFNLPALVTHFAVR
ncbi:MAG: hypothetical protein HYX49_07740 [Chloroflexi bacterium]|nr:hypothetical protein [Chloroflexota bacterium]